MRDEKNAKTNWVHLGGDEKVHGMTYFPPDSTVKCVPPANNAAFLKAGDEEEAVLPFAIANVVVAATATSTATTASSPAEVARTVFGGIIAACCLYVAYRVGIGIHKPAVSKFPAPDYTNAEAEISEI